MQTLVRRTELVMEGEVSGPESDAPSQRERRWRFLFTLLLSVNLAFLAGAITLVGLMISR